jgi:uracil-DNA glycosylase
MSEDFASLQQQRRLLLSLGFGFVEEQVPLTTLVPQQAPPVQHRTTQRRANQPPTQQRPQPPVAPPTNLKPLAALPPVSPEERKTQLQALKQQILACTSCPLQFTRQTPLAGEGLPDAKAMFICEIPTADEDSSGVEFSGPIGEMLLKITGAIKLTRDEIFLTYSNKCHPPGGRKPSPAEFNTCIPYLSRQVELVRPQVIVCFGQLATGALLPHLFQQGMQEARGNWQHYRGVPLMPTLALPNIFNNQARKKIVWEDLQQVMKKLQTPTS